MRKVLIVDDNEENLYYLRVLLEASGWQVQSAQNGEEALRFARFSPPDLVISDLLMPVMDGYALLRHWKGDASLLCAPFIVYSATYVDAADEQLAVGMGADDFILKPSEPAALLARVDEVMTRHDSLLPTGVEVIEVSETDLLSLYSERLVQKLEKKSLELEAANLALKADIRHRQEIEMKLRESETLLRIAGRAAKLGGWSIDLPSFQGRWSDEVCVIHEAPLGTSPTTEEAINFCAPEFHELVSQRVEECIREGVSFDFELQIVTTKGRRVWVRAIGHAERDASGSISRLVGAFQDIDDQRKLEEQFRQAQKMEAVGHLAGGIAHDFNNTLSVILGYSDLILDNLDSGHALRQDIVEIHQAGLRAADVTRKLLVFSRQQVLDLQVLEIGLVIVGLEFMLKRLLGAGIELSIITSFSRGKVLADAGQFEQVILNLGINSRDAMPNGGKLSFETVDVDLDAEYCSYHVDVTPGPYVMLAVTDTGIGMSADTVQRIFEPFFTTKENGKGTGLGLSSVFGIIKQARGHIDVFSELDRGTTFQIYVPRTGRERRPTAAIKVTPSSLRGSETILLVEDEEAVRKVLGAVLRRQGYLVLEAEHGDEAILVCEQLTSKLHLVITDLIMPRMGGRKLIGRLRVQMPKLPVLFISGQADRVAANGEEKPDLEIFLAKPITQDTLTLKVRELLDRGNG